MSNIRLETSSRCHKFQFPIGEETGSLVRESGKEQLLLLSSSASEGSTSLSWLLSEGKLKMKLVVCAMLLYVSQHALSGVIEVNEGAEFVLLPCLYSSTMPDDPIVTWTNNEVSPKYVHLRRDKDDFRDQHERYKGRTSMASNALDPGNFSLTLREPRPSDQGSYICSISDGREEYTLRDLQLKVKDDQVNVEVKEGADSVILPCTTSANLPDDARVVWTRLNPEPLVVHVHLNSSQPGTKQDELYCRRTEMNEDFLITGDLSLTLKFPTVRDGGSYICTVYRDQDILRQRVVLKLVKEQISPQAKVLMVLMILLVGILLAGGALFYYFRHYVLSAYKVEVDSGVESVLLPCKKIVHLPEHTRVDWKTSSNMKVHVYQQGWDRSEEQHLRFHNRTMMNKDPLTTGDLGLRLNFPTNEDSDTYSCIASSTEGYILLKKDVKLHIKVPQVKVNSGVESVLLPFKTTFHLLGDIKVEWRNRENDIVHQYQNGSEFLEEQDEFYRDRTKITGDLLRTRDLSLTLKHPIDRDSNFYTCSIFKEGNILLKKQVQLLVTVQQVKVESGVESVLLPCKIKDPVPEDATVEWRNGKNVQVCYYTKSSDKNERQSRFYRERTEMNQGLPHDLSLTLKHLTEEDTDIYTCTICSKEGNILMKKQVQLHVTVCRVEVGEGEESVQLPFITTAKLPGDATVVWGRVDPEPKKMVHMYYNGSNQEEDQDEFFEKRTGLNEDLLQTGDLSLSLRCPTESDSGQYECWIESEQICRKQRVLLKVKGTGQVKDQTEDIENRREIELTHLMTTTN